MTKRNYFLFDGEGTGAQTGSNTGVAPGEGNEPEDKADDLFDEGLDEGTEPDDEGSNGDSTDPKDLNAEFDNLIKTKYKDIYDSRVKDTLSKRFKSADADRSKLSRYEESLLPLFDKYNIDPGDVDGLTKAIASDDALIEDKAAEEGLTVEQYKYRQKLEAENKRLTTEERRRQARAEADALYEDWELQSKELRETYPNFDLKKEAAGNEEFMSYLEAGLSVKKAYEAAHFEEILSGAIQTTAQVTRKNTADKIRARGLRPRENGMQSKAPIRVKRNIGELTAEDMEKINARVMRGETVTF